MKHPTATIMLAALGLAWGGEAIAQQTNRLDCEGFFGGYPAAIGGTRYSQRTATLNEYVRFEGQIAVAGQRGTIAWEGAYPPYQGIVQIPTYSATIGVLDNTGGRLVIYGGQASLGPPPELGQFGCQWR